MIKSASINDLSYQYKAYINQKKKNDPQIEESQVIKNKSQKFLKQKFYRLYARKQILFQSELIINKSVWLETLKILWCTNMRFKILYDTGHEGILA